MNLSGKLSSEYKPVSTNLWIFTLIILFIFGFFGPVWTTMIPGGFTNWYTAGTVGCKLWVPVLPTVLIFLLGILREIGLFKSADKTAFAFLYVATIGLVVFLSYDGWPLQDTYTGFLASRVVEPGISDNWPSIFAPPADVVRPIVSGGAPVPWGALMPFIVFWWLMMVAYAVFYLAIASLLRHHYIDVEKVPFPQTIVSVTLASRFLEQGSLRKKLGVPLIVGIVLGLVYQIPLFFTALYPWFPDIYGWRTNTCNHGTVWLTAGSALAQLPGMAMLNKSAVHAAIFFLAPLSVLTSAVITNIIFQILMQVAYFSGYYSGILGLDGCGRVWCGTISYRVGEPFKWDAFSTAGVSTGIVLFYFILNWRAVSSIIRQAIRGEEVKGEPINYRTAFLMIILAVIVIAALWGSVGLTLAPIVVLILSNFICTFASTRVYSLVGYNAPAGSWFYYGPMKLVMGSMPTEANYKEWVLAMCMMHPTGQAFTEGWGTPLITSLSSYKMGSMMGMDNKTIFKVSLVVGILAPLLAQLGYIWGLYTFGATKLPSSLWGGVWYRADPQGIVNRPVRGEWIPHFLGGILLAGALSYLHAKFLWFPLDPIGFLIITDGHALIEGLWTTVTAAWAIKLIILRVGGSKFYEEVGVPVAIGFIVGAVLVSFIGGLLMVVRFFVPF